MLSNSSRIKESSKEKALTIYKHYRRRLIKTGILFTVILFLLMFLLNYITYVSVMLSLIIVIIICLILNIMSYRAAFKLRCLEVEVYECENKAMYIITTNNEKVIVNKEVNLPKGTILILIYTDIYEDIYPILIYKKV